MNEKPLYEMLPPCIREVITETYYNELQPPLETIIKAAYTHIKYLENHLYQLIIKNGELVTHLRYYNDSLDGIKSSVDGIKSIIECTKIKGTEEFKEVPLEYRDNFTILVERKKNG